MRLIRAFEEHVVSASNAGLVPGSTHPCIGQEAIAVGVCSALRPDDLILATYRGHGEYLAKGGDPREAMAEIMCREPGCCKGKGGSMHLCDPEKGIIMTNAIVAGHIPAAGGVALSCKLRGTGQVVAVFFGDGAACEGEFFETLNMAQLWEVPLIFICENNGYSISVPLSMSQATPDIADRAKGVGMANEIVDGNDLLAVREATERAADHARSGRGPYFIECKTVRWERHSALSAGYYESEEERHRWKEVDPIPRFRSFLLSKKVVTGAELDDLDQEAARVALDAREFAQAAPPPSEDTILADIFAEGLV